MSEPRPTLAERVALHVLETPERHDPPTPHCDFCWEEWPCTVRELADLLASRVTRVRLQDIPVHPS